MLVEVDLPPVDGVPRPWVGTEPRRAMDNDASTSCDNADFRAEPMSNNVTRTFVIPGSKLPAQFGLTETVGTMRLRKRAKAFVEEIRGRMAACPDKRPRHRGGAGRPPRRTTTATSASGTSPPRSATTSRCRS